MMLRQLQSSLRRSRERSSGKTNATENGRKTTNANVIHNGRTCHRQEMVQNNNPVNGDISRPLGDTRAGVTSSTAEVTSHAAVTSSPLPPLSPKSLSRSPSLRRKELAGMHESVTSFMEAETSPLLKEIDNALNRKYDLGVWQPGQAPEAPEVNIAENKEKVDDTPLDIKEPVWTPKSSPTSGRKQFRPINYDSSSLERKKKESSEPPAPPPPPSESFAWRAPEVPERLSSVPLRSSSLPRPESATVTLLREARRGHLPRGAQYLPLELGVYPSRGHPRNPPRQLRPPPVKEVEGVGPTLKSGMPLSLRSTVKGENQQDWYRRVYDNLHRQPQPRSSYGLGGYCSEPDLTYEDDLDPSSSLQSRNAAERYRGHPGRIEDYTPGKSSLAEHEASKYWAEVMGYFDKFLDDHAHIQPKRPIRAARSEEVLDRTGPKAGYKHPAPLQDSFTPRALEGYDSDSTLVYHRAAPPDLTSNEQKLYYNQIQRGGDVPLTGLRKPAPEKPKIAASRYQEAAVNIHYRSPVRWEEREPLSDQELQQRQEDNMRRVYQEARRKKEEKQREDILSRRHGDNFTPSQKSPIPLDRYERLFDDVADSSAPTLTATALHEFRAQNNRELSLTRGDTVRIRRKIDSNWYEGQKSSRIGIFPVSYVRVHDPRERSVERWAPRPQVRARHRFSAQTHLELSLSKGDIVSVIRRVDDNWYEGRRGDAIGIFPISYVEAIGNDAQRDHSGLRMKPVGAPAAHGLVKDGNALRAPGDPLKVDVQQPPVPYRVQFSYRHQNDDELDLEEGDVIHVLERCPDGWYVGTNLRTGMFGTFPGNYTAKM